MRIQDFYASDRALAKMLGKHQVYWDEVEEIMDQSLPPRRTRSPRGRRRYYVVGQTGSGRPLKVVFELEPQHIARILTAYEFRP